MHHAKAAFLAVSISLAFLVSSLPVYAELPFLGGWSYRKLITYDGVSGAGAGYVVFVKTYYATGTDSIESLTGGHKGINASAIYLSGNCQADFDDVRFTDNDAQTQLDFFRDSKTDSDYALFAVEVSDNLNADCSFYVYYGNIDASSDSNASATFKRVISSGISLALPLNEGSGVTVNDYSGNDNDGVITDADWVTTGRFGNGISFADATDKIVIPDDVSLQLGSTGTLACYTRSSGVQADFPAFFNKATGGTAGTISYLLYRNGLDLIVIYLSDGVDAVIADYSWDYLDSNEHFITGQWNNSKLWVSFDTMKGTLQDQGINPQANFDLTLGNFFPQYKGVISGSYIFSDSLSDAVVSDLNNYYPQCSSANLGSLYLRSFVDPEPQPLYFGDEESAYVNSNDALAIGMLGFIFAIGAMGLVLLNRGKRR